MKFVDYLVEFFLAENRRLSAKAIVILFCVLLLFLINNIFGFTFHYNRNQNIEGVEKLNKILSDQHSDSATIRYAFGLRKQLMERKNVFDHLTEFFSFKKRDPAVAAVPESTPISSANNDTKNNFWFNMSAAGLIFLITIVMIPVGTIKDNSKSILFRIATSIIAGLLLFGFGYVLIWLFSFIPKIGNTWTLNYIINYILQIFILSCYMYIVAYKKKKEKMIRQKRAHDAGLYNL